MQSFMMMLLLLHPGHDVSGCGGLYWDATEEAYESFHARTLNNLDVIKKRMGIRLPIILCESKQGSTPYVPIAAMQLHTEEDDEPRGYVFIPREAMEQYSFQALRGLIAHELAHSLVESSTDCKMMRFRLDIPPIKEQVACETPMDIIAAKWVGLESTLLFLEATRMLLMQYTESQAVRRRLAERMQLRTDAVLAHFRRQ